MQLGCCQGLKRSRNMLQIGVIVLSVLVSSAYGTWETDLKVKFGVSLSGDVFVGQPLNQSLATAAGWVEKGNSAHSGLESLVRMCEPTNYLTCLFYDDNGYIAGVQIAINASEFTPLYDADSQGYLMWETTLDGETVTYYTLHVYFVNSTYLETDASERAASHDSSVLTPLGSFWLSAANGGLSEVSMDSSKLVDSGYTLQRFVPLMGKHYFKNMTSTTECTAEGLYPHFVLMNDNQILGTGMVLIGTFADTVTEFETPGGAGVGYIVEDGPDCLYELANNGNIETYHVYFIKTPYLVLLSG